MHIVTLSAMSVFFSLWDYIGSGAAIFLVGYLAGLAFNELICAAWRTPDDRSLGLVSCIAMPLLGAVAGLGS